MSKQPNFGKSLSGYTPLSAAVLETIGESVAAVMSSGLTLNNVTISGGTIDGVTTGSSSPGILYVTNFYSGQPGIGYTGCFYGNTVGKSACWDPVTATWNISGNLTVTDTSKFGNLQILNNTLSSTNPNGNIFINTLGTGVLNITAPINQTTTNGNIIFNTTNGTYNLNSGLTNTLNSGTNTDITTQNGDITLETGLAIPLSNITFITTGVSSVTVTTSTNHGLVTGDKVTITGTNNGTDGVYTVGTIFSNTTFSIPVSSPVLSTGTVGTVVKHNNIYLTASDSIYIPQDTLLTFGDVSTLSTDGTNTILDTGTGNFTVNGDLKVIGDTTYIKSTVVSIDDPVFNVGGIDPLIVDDGMNRGISGKYYDTTSKLMFFGRNSSGCFTYIPDAIEVSPNVFTGTPGCMTVGPLTSTNVTITGGGTITGLTNLTVPTLNTCNITCTGVMTITGTSGVNIVSPLVTTSSHFTATGTITGATGVFTGVISGGSSTITGNTTTGSLNVTNNTTTGTLTVNNLATVGSLNVTNDVHILGDLIVDDTITTLDITSTGTANVNNLNITGIITGLPGITIEHLSITGGGVVSPAAAINITFINITSSGIATGVLPNGTVDGFIKYIFISSSVSGSSYKLTATSNLIDIGTGTTASKVLTFKTAGYSIVLMWDHNNSHWLFINAGVCIGST